MVEFVLNEWKKVIIHEISKYDLDDLLRLHTTGILPGGATRSFLWANGVIFEHSNMPPTGDIIKEQLNGIIHWSSLQFAFMPEYKTTIPFGTVSLQIVNVNSNRTFFEMASFLKEKYRES